MKHTLTLILSLFLWNASAQLHHQMLSSQGSTSKTQKGVIVTQTIGQQSVNGNYTAEGFNEFNTFIFYSTGVAHYIIKQF